MEDTILRRTWAEIDLDALEHNYNVARQKIGPGVKYLGVVKADAYGHGAVQVARKLEQLGADYLAVSSLDEGRELRHGGITMPILILGHTPPEMVSQLIEYNITQAVSAKAKAEAYSAEAVKCGGTLRVHIKVDTGMSRLGFLVRGEHFEGGVNAIAESCALPGLDAEGIFTHFAVSDMDGAEYEAYTREQFGVFTHVLDALAAKGRTFRIRHCANSGALTRYPEMYLDMVRPGIALYGVLSAPGDATTAVLPLRPVLSLRARVSQLHTLAAGEAAGYDGAYTAHRPTVLATLSIGYADGIPRCLSGGKLRAIVRGQYAQVLLHGRTAPIVGLICMDQLLVDVTDMEGVAPGDTATLIGRGGDAVLTAEEAAQAAGTITNELLSRLGPRLERVVLP